MAPAIRSLSAATLAVRDMARAVAFYRAAGFEVIHGGPDAAFTTFGAGDQFLNLSADDGSFQGLWGRLIFHVEDVDAVYRRLRQRGLTPAFEPRDAPWGERYFHIRDPDGHEISFAKPLSSR